MSTKVKFALFVLFVFVLLVNGYFSNSLPTVEALPNADEEAMLIISKPCTKWHEAGPRRIREAHCLPHGVVAAPVKQRPVMDTEARSFVPAAPVVTPAASSSTVTVADPVTPEPVATPDPVATPEPVTVVIIIVDTDTDTEDDTCKNKNSGKDGTPLECNAGKGQEKKAGGG